MVPGSCLGHMVPGSWPMARTSKDEAFMEKVTLHIKQYITRYILVLYMQSVLILQCFICNVSLYSSALYAKCPYTLVIYMQSVLIFFSALYAMCPYNLVLYMQSVLIL